MVGGKRGDRRDDDAVARATNKQRPIAVPHVRVDLAPGLNALILPLHYEIMMAFTAATALLLSRT